MSRKPERVQMPAEIRILGRTIPIHLESSHLNTRNVGSYSYSNGTIALDVNLGEESMKATAVHEVVHDFDSVMGTELGEQGVCGIGIALFSFIRDNPKFLAWVAQGL